MRYKSFLSIHDFGVKNAKINFLKKISVLSAVFIQFKYRWLKTCLVVSKNTKHLTIFLTDFYEFLKIDNFPNFPNFLEIISWTS